MPSLCWLLPRLHCCASLFLMLPLLWKMRTRKTPCPVEKVWVDKPKYDEAERLHYEREAMLAAAPEECPELEAVNGVLNDEGTSRVSPKGTRKEGGTGKSRGRGRGLLNPKARRSPRRPIRSSRVCPRSTCGLRNPPRITPRAYPGKKRWICRARRRLRPSSRRPKLPKPFPKNRGCPRRPCPAPTAA